MSERDIGGRRMLAARYGVLAAGICVMALGVAITTRAHLGTSPISAPPWVMALRGGWTFGQYTFALNVLMVLLQLALRRRRFKLLTLLQLPFAVLFGVAIDAAMWMTQALDPSAYVVSVAQNVLGASILGIGVAIEVAPRVLTLAGEGAVLAISEEFRLPFGRTKVGFDVSLVAIAVALSFAFWGELRGVREGTVLSALLVGLVVGWSLPTVRRVLARLLGPGFDGSVPAP